MIRTPSKVMMVSSSPGRAESKLPAPVLTTLLRGKSGSRSRGRSSASVSRSSPMFTARRRGTVPEEKEPSSPKVSCIGQVRTSKRKSSAPSASSSSAASTLRSNQQQKQGGCVPRGCRCFRRGFFCNPFSNGFKPSSSSASASPYRQDSRGWRKWFLLPRSGCYRQRKPPRQRQQDQEWLNEEPPRMSTGILQADVAGSDDDGERSEQGEVDDDDGGEEETKVFVPTTPPKNALLLMRCRSAPHRAACVPDRFSWVSSPYGAGESASAASTAAAVPAGMEQSRGESREEEPISDYSVSSYEARAGINDGGAAGESREGEDDDGEAAAVGPSPSFSSRPLILTRCKSEPARKAAKLAAAPDAPYCFWNGGTNKSSKNSSKNSSSSSNNKRWLTLLGEARPIPSQ